MKAIFPLPWCRGLLQSAREGSAPGRGAAVQEVVVVVVVMGVMEPGGC